MGQMYRLYTDASDYAIAGALQQIQYIAVKDLKGTRAYRCLLDAHKKGVQPPELTTRLSKEHDDRRPLPNWDDSWEETMICQGSPISQFPYPEIPLAEHDG